MMMTLATVSNVPIAMPCVQHKMQSTTTVSANGIKADEIEVTNNAIKNRITMTASPWMS